MDLRFQVLKTFAVFLFVPFLAVAQLNPEAGSDDELTLRDLQLLGYFPDSYSFTVRPVFRRDSLGGLPDFYFQDSEARIVNPNRYLRFRLLPMAWGGQWNSNSPWGRNNGSYVLAKGYQFMANAGFEFSSKLLDVRFYPDALFLEQDSMRTSSKPLFFGRNSMIRLKAGRWLALSAGTESLWWGPSVFNSLMMSNNAPGFPHLSLNTYQPLKLPFGTIEFQLLVASLRNGSGLPLENSGLRTTEQVFPDRLSNERYFNGINFAFQPSFLKGLTIGINRSIQYSTIDRSLQGNFMLTYLPVISPAFVSNVGGKFVEDDRKRDQLANIFLRFMFPEFHFEVHGEYGWNDHKNNLRDLVLNPDHASAYNLGFRKVIPGSEKSFWTIEAELTQLAPTNSEIARPSGNWYVHFQVLEGYTNFGQIIGGGVGPGDNTATLRVSRTTSKLKQSILFERFQHDPVFQSMKWTDWILGLRHQQHAGHFTFIGSVDVLRRNNFNFTDQEIFTVQPSMRILYHWKK